MRFPVCYNTESAWSIPPRLSNTIYSLSHSEHPLTTYLRHKWQEQRNQNRCHSKKPHVETNARSERNKHDNDPSESPTRRGHDDDWVSHPDSEPPGEEVNPQEDDNPVPGLEVQPDDLPGGPNDWNPDDLVPHLEALCNSSNFVDCLHMASLDNDAIPPDVRERLRSPPTALPAIDADLCMCIEIFLGTTNGSQSMYETVCRAIRWRSPEIQTLSYKQMRRKLVDLTGVIPVMTDMCFDLCVAFTGPFSELRTCPECSSAWYETVMQGNRRVSVPRKQALTIPVGPQIQAQYRSHEGAWNMGHRVRVMEPLLAKLRDGGSIETYDDVYCSSILIDAARRGDLASDDVVLMLSVDGAQLYQSKQLDCWIYIWVLLDLAPDLRYKKKYVLPGGFIPGPNKPKNLDSFMYTGLHHLAALQKDGLRIWNCLTGRVYTSRPYFFLGTADGPGLAVLHGQVGHHSMFGCREYCGLQGRHKPGGLHYYPMLLKPLDYNLPGCNHGDGDVYRLPQTSVQLYFKNLHHLIPCATDAEFRLVHKETGICKASLFVGLSRE